MQTVSRIAVIISYYCYLKYDCDAEMVSHDAEERRRARLVFYIEEVDERQRERSAHQCNEAVIGRFKGREGDE
jgi:phage terminase Nu1 subunit (DNA packaging protein)